MRAARPWWCALEEVEEVLDVPPVQHNDLKGYEKQPSFFKSKLESWYAGGGGNGRQSTCTQLGATGN